MLSTLITRNGGQKIFNVLKTTTVPVRHGGGGGGAVVEGELEYHPYKENYPSSVIEQLPLDEKISNWQRAHQIFFGPERDFKNYPIPKMPLKPETYQFGFIPTRWFLPLYEKIGVTGCYTTIWGTIIFLINKELFPVASHQGCELPHCIATLSILMCIYARPLLRAKFDQLHADRRRWRYEEPLENAKASYVAETEEIKTDLWRKEAIPAIYEAKEEIVDLQLETHYRQRLDNAYKTVKQRLDYQLELETTKRKFEQDHMVQWIVDNVKKSITPQQEKESITNCIATLKSLSATAKA